MKSVKLLGRLSIVFLFLSCAGVGVLETNDPKRKIDDAYSLMELGRYALAQKLFHEALEIYETQNNLLGQAQAHSSLGDLNRDAKGASMPNYAKAIAHFKAAALLFKRLKKPKWHAFTLYALAGVQSLDGKKEEACRALMASRTIYASAPNFESITENFERGGAFSYASYPGLIKYFGCSN